MNYVNITNAHRLYGICLNIKMYHNRLNKVTEKDTELSVIVGFSIGMPVSIKFSRTKLLNEKNVWIRRMQLRKTIGVRHKQTNQRDQ